MNAYCMVSLLDLKSSLHYAAWRMDRIFHRLSVVLAVALVAAMPAHFAFDHGHELLHLDSHGRALHVHEKDCDLPCVADACDSESPDLPEFHDASGCEDSHGHTPHTHTISDHSYLSVRTASVFAVAWVPSPLRDAFAVSVSTTPADTVQVPEHQTPCLDFPAQRGPPLS